LKRKYCIMNQTFLYSQIKELFHSDIAYHASGFLCITYQETVLRK